jgi:hypothetical protein
MLLSGVAPTIVVLLGMSHLMVFAWFAAAIRLASSCGPEGFWLRP